MSINFVAKLAQVIINDDEGATFLFAKWSDIGGYLSISCDEGDPRLYCEYCDQSNGFYSETICMKTSNNRVGFTLTGKESFSTSEFIQEINVTFNELFDDVALCVDALKNH